LPTCLPARLGFLRGNLFKVLELREASNGIGPVIDEILDLVIVTQHRSPQVIADVLIEHHLGGRDLFRLEFGICYGQARNLIIQLVVVRRPEGGAGTGP